MPELEELCRAAVEAARGGEAVEAYAEESTRTEVEARRGEVEGLTFAETRGVGVRVIVDGRLGFSYAADPSLDEIRSALDEARANAALATADEDNVLPDAMTTAPMEGLYFEDQAAMSTQEKVRIALDLERVATSSDPRVTKLENCSFGDTTSRVAIASTEGVASSFRRTGCWVVVVSLAEEDGDTQTGFSFQVGRRLADIDPDAVAREAVNRAARMLGAAKPETTRVPVILDPFAASSFLGVLAGALSGEAVLKGRSLFADKVGERVGSDVVTLIDDGREIRGPAAAPFDDEGVPTERTELVSGGVLNGFLHDAYTARRSGTISTGNASRAGYRSTPGVGTSNFWIEPGDRSFAQLLADADGGVLIQDVSGVHSGANPISGEFSVGATGLRISGAALGEPVREMTIASTIPEMLGSITAVGSDLRFFTSVGTPSILIGEMTVAGV